MTAPDGVPIRVGLEEGGELLSIALDRPKANILDTAMIDAILEVLSARQASSPLKAILFESTGPHFSFGASVEEHRPDQVGKMLPRFHRLFIELSRSGRVILAAVPGQCLGGGLELAAFAHRLFVAPGACLGQPEIRLAVFAPVASLILPARIGQVKADELLLTGRTVEAREALSIGLADELTSDPGAAARAWFRANLATHSAAALRHAVLAARHRFHADLEAGLEALERQYLDELMRTADAREGIEAFLARRTPTWQHQ